MKFISKSSNLLIVLKPGLSAQPLTGTPSIPTVSVRFKDGIAEVADDELVKRMLIHPGFNQDYISAEDVNGVDPYAAIREESEPTHLMTELKYGTPVGFQAAGGKTKLPPGLAKLVQDEAVKLATAMLPTMIEETLKKIVESSQLEKAIHTPEAEITTTEKATQLTVKAKNAKKAPVENERLITAA